MRESPFHRDFGSERPPCRRERFWTRRRVGFRESGLVLCQTLFSGSEIRQNSICSGNSGEFHYKPTLTFSVDGALGGTGRGADQQQPFAAQK